MAQHDDWRPPPREPAPELERGERGRTELEPLPDSDAIHDRLARVEKSHPEFWKHYDTFHFWAGRDTLLGLERRGRLMLGGFHHAVYELELEIP